MGTEVVVRNARLLGEASLAAALPCATSCPNAAARTRAPMQRMLLCSSAVTRVSRGPEHPSLHSPLSLGDGCVAFSWSA